MRRLALLTLLTLAACAADVSAPRLPPPSSPELPAEVSLTVFLRAFDSTGAEVSACDLRVIDRDLGELARQACWTEPLRFCVERGAAGCLQSQALATANFAARFPRELAADIARNPRSVSVVDASGRRVGAAEHVYILATDDVTPHAFFAVTR